MALYAVQYPIESPSANAECALVTENLFLAALPEILLYPTRVCVKTRRLPTRPEHVPPKRKLSGFRQGRWAVCALRDGSETAKIWENPLHAPRDGGAEREVFRAFAPPAPLCSFYTNKPGKTGAFQSAANPLFHAVQTESAGFGFLARFLRQNPRYVRINTPCPNTPSVSPVYRSRRRFHRTAPHRTACSGR